ncbi:uncharacterized protein BDR25DRAFT_377299 [Lindgomyces ingoldianus]|uniref:Uncharacterized protein n=1 Tax=Lindgomyces ingoldianus TaxID=673940 RepID=A0ACB6QJA6_9PLEO|nr:uncharacterized protein BDR25DRAFT_377299 [Lindgomyces ingoldianus]KAF2466220.1 hypothetical protein BDR25DRAFT_377299 [Lindgomyces ingoldianus]
MHIHMDQITIQPPIRGVAVGMNLTYFLEDVFPRRSSDDPYDSVDTVVAARSVGTCMVFETML